MRKFFLKENQFQKKLQKIKIYLKSKFNEQIVKQLILPKNTLFIIDPRGYVNSKRRAYDGFTYFGCKRKNAKTEGEAV